MSLRRWSFQQFFGLVTGNTTNTDNVGCSKLYLLFCLEWSTPQKTDGASYSRCEIVWLNFFLSISYRSTSLVGQNYNLTIFTFLFSQGENSYLFKSAIFSFFVVDCLRLN